MEQNNCKRVTVLNGKDESICFNKRAFEIVKMSTKGKALGFFAGGLGSTLILGTICPPLGLAAGLGIGIYSIVDAVKNAKA